MTELQYNARCNEIESEIETLDKEMTRLHDEILQSRVTGDYSKISECLDLFLKKSDRMAELVKERTALRHKKMKHGFDEPLSEAAEVDDVECEIDCRNDFCEGDRVKANRDRKTREGTVVCVHCDFLVIRFDDWLCGYDDSFTYYDLFELYTAEQLHKVKKI